jgi:anti-sigma factor RsiW
MNCPLNTPETADQLLDYCARKLSPDAAAVLERHMSICPECRKFAADQRAVWSALDAWEAQPVPVDFDRRLYQRIESQVSWRDRFLRPLLAYRGLPAAAAACLLLAVGVYVERPGRPTPPARPDVAVADVQPEQVVKALDTMEMLSEFNHRVAAEAPASKL